MNGLEFCHQFNCPGYAFLFRHQRFAGVDQQGWRQWACAEIDQQVIDQYSRTAESITEGAIAQVDNGVANMGQLSVLSSEKA